MELKQVIVVRKDLKLGQGKLAAQVGHACIEAFLKTEKKFPELAEEWLEQGQQKIVLKVESKDELVTLFEELKNQFPCALIKDAGLTQIPAGTITCMGIGPVDEAKINKYTAKLKLL